MFLVVVIEDLQQSGLFHLLIHVDDARHDVGVGCVHVHTQDGSVDIAPDAVDRGQAERTLAVPAFQLFLQLPGQAIFGELAGLGQVDHECGRGVLVHAWTCQALLRLPRTRHLGVVPVAQPFEGVCGQATQIEACLCHGLYQLWLYVIET